MIDVDDGWRETLFEIDNPLADELVAVRVDIASKAAGADLIDTILMAAMCLAVTIAECRGDVDPGASDLAPHISFHNFDDSLWLDLDLDRYFDDGNTESATPEEIDALTDAAHQVAWHAYYAVRNANLLAELQQAA